MLQSPTIDKVIYDYTIMDLSQTDVVLVQNIKDKSMVIWTTEEELDNPLLSSDWQIIGHINDFPNVVSLKNKLKIL